MKIVLLLLSSFIAFGCSQNKITWKHQIFLKEIEHCFAPKDAYISNKQSVLDFLAGNLDVDIHSLNIANEHGELINYVQMERKVIFGILLFHIGKDRRFIAPWMSSCEALREMWFDPNALELQ